MENQSGWTPIGESDGDLLAVRVVVADDCLRVVLAGELDLGEVAALDREVRRTMQVWPSPRVLKLDLSHLKFVDLEGLRALAGVCRRLERSAGSFSVVGAPRLVLRAMEVAGVVIPALENAPLRHVASVRDG